MHSVMLRIPHMAVILKTLMKPIWTMIIRSGRIVESSAAAADVGGPMATLKALFAGLPAEAFAGAMAKSSVTPQALGAGYLVFFLYSSAIGIVAIVLAFMVAARQPPAPDPAPQDRPPEPP